MKKILYLLLLLIISCGSSDDPAPITVYIPVANQPAPPPEPPTEPVPHPAIVAIYNQATSELGTSNGITYNTFGHGQVANARDSFISVDDILHGIDADTGESIISQQLPCIPSAVAIAADTWSFEVIPKADAQAMGAMARVYTRIWQNGTEFGNWYENQWEVVDAFVTESRNIIAVDIVQKYRNIHAPDMVVYYADHEGLMIHDIDTGNRTGYITDKNGTSFVGFTTNYFTGANQWERSGDLWHSWNGYTWDGSTLREQVTALAIFTEPLTEYPYIVSAGTRTETGENVSYWIDCNTGQLYRYTSSTDSLEEVMKLYQGDGLRASGVIVAADINPVMTTQGLFYKYDGTVYKYDFTTVTSFAGDVVVWGM